MKKKEEYYRTTPKGFFIAYESEHLLDLLLATMVKNGENAIIWDDVEREFVWAKVERQPKKKGKKKK